MTATIPVFETAPVSLEGWLRIFAVALLASLVATADQMLRARRII